MNLLLQPIFAAILAAILRFQVDGRVCYPGQGPGPDSTGLLWSLKTTADPAECTEYRLGGLNLNLNTRPLRTTNQITIGGDREVLNLRPGGGPGGTSEKVLGLPCVTFTSPGGSNRLLGPYPARANTSMENIEYTVEARTPTKVNLYFCETDDFCLSQIESTYKTLRETGKGVEFPARLWFKFANGEFELRCNGTSLFSDEGTRVNWNVSHVSVYSATSQLDWQIYSPCY